MIKKVLSTATVAASVIGATAMAASPALAIGDDQGPQSMNGNGSQQAYGNQETKGAFSPQNSLVQGSLNKPCIALPAKVNAGSLVGLVPITVQDLPVLSSSQNQQCAENSSQNKGDDALSHLLDDVPILSGNGSAGR